MVELPGIDTTTTAQLLLDGQSKASEVSLGLLSDFSVASPLTAILEANAAIASQVIGAINGLAVTLESNRLAIFQMDRQQGSPALGTVQVNLDALYNVPFLLAKGFLISFGGVNFETLGDLLIPPFQQSGTVAIGALDDGKDGNLPQGAIATYQPVAKIASIALASPTQGGLDEESEAEWKARIYGLLRRRDTLVSVEDFEAEIIDYLGAGSTALAIAKLKPDKLNLANGYVGCFGLNPDGTDLNAAQLADLSSYLSAKAAMATVTLWSLGRFNITISTVAGFSSGSDPAGLAIAVDKAVRDYLAPGKLPPGSIVLNKAIELKVQQVTGIVEGVVSVQLNGLAQPQPLPYPWAIAILSSHHVTLTQSGQQFDYFF